MIFQVAEHGLGHLPFTEKQITTPTGILENVICILCVCVCSCIILFVVAGLVPLVFVFKYAVVADVTKYIMETYSIAGSIYTGVDFCKKLCAVSIIRR